MIQRASLSKQRLDVCFENIFLTGSTGVLGAHLMKELLSSTGATLYCLTRAQNEEQARERLSSFLGVYDPEGELVEEFRRRVIPVLGDVTAPNLGLSEVTYSKLSRTIDATVHSAALTNLFVKLRTIEPINVGGTANIVRFALSTAKRYLVHISSHTVIGDKVFDESVRFTESDLDLGQGFEYMSYQKTKFLSEKLVREATAEGLQWNIVRPGQIFGDSRTGDYPLKESNVSGLFYDIFKTIIETGLAMEAGTHFDIVPVDYVSRGTIALCLASPETFRTYHLTNPDIKTYSQVTRIVRSLGYDLKIVPQDEYERALLANEIRKNGVEYKSSTTSAFKWWFRRGIRFERGGVTDCTMTAGKLSKLGLSCPPIDAALLRTYCETAARKNYLPPPPKRVAANTQETYEVSP